MFQKISLFFVITALTIACDNQEKAKSGVVFLTLKGPSAIGMINLIDSPGSVIPEKLDIRIIEEPMLVRAQMIKEKPDLAVLPLNMAAILYNMNLGYQVIAIPVWGTLHLYGTDTLIRNWKDLKNKRVYMMGKGTTPDILFRHLLTQNGIDPEKDAILDYSFPTHIDLANAIVAGKVSLAVISEPLATFALIKNPALRKIIDLNHEWSDEYSGSPMPQTAWLGRTNFIRDHPDWIFEIGKAWSNSIDMVNQRPSSAASKIVRYSILPDSAAAVKSIPGCNLKFRYASDMRKQINQYLQVFLTFNPDAVGGNMPDEKFIFEKPDH